MYVCMYVRMHVCMYVCMCVCLNVRTVACIHGHIYKLSYNLAPAPALKLSVNLGNTKFQNFKSPQARSGHDTLSPDPYRHIQRELVLSILLTAINVIGI